jgi:predicted enzyme related to lactoylglutathione lyase
VIEYFGGVIIWTDNLAPMVRFYRDVLELPVHSIHPDFAVFEVGGIRLSVGLHSQIHGPARDRLRLMVNLGVEDIHAAFRTLAGRGVEFSRPPEREHWGGWIATFVDPDGNLLQLLQTHG